MKKHFICLVSFIIALLPACSNNDENQEDEQQQEVTIIGTWQSYEYYELDDSGSYPIGRELHDNFFATFTETEATLDDGSRVIKSTYVERESMPKVYDFPQAEEEGYQIIAQIIDDDLGVTIGSDRYVCKKRK